MHIQNFFHEVDYAVVLMDAIGHKGPYKSMDKTKWHNLLIWNYVRAEKIHLQLMPH